MQYAEFGSYNLGSSFSKVNTFIIWLGSNFMYVDKLFNTFIGYNSE